MEEDESMSIPKIIHYCWFGGKEIPQDLKNYMDSWKTYLPDYRIMEWNETNVDLEANEFIKAAYEEKRFAFVSDYARLLALYQYGGIYFDVDIEVKKSFDGALLEKDGLFCFESDEKVMTAFMGAKKESPLMKEFLDSYENRKFDKEHLVPNTDLFTEILKERGLQLNGKGQSLGTIEVFPSTFFSAFNLKDFSYDITEHTYTVHHFYGSWCPPSERLFFGFRKKLRSIFGQQAYEKLKKIKKKIIG